MKTDIPDQPIGKCYVIRRSGSRIEERDYYRRTEKCVWTRWRADGPTRKQAIESQFEKFFFDRDAAVNAVRERLTSAVRSLTQDLHEAHESLTEFNEREGGRK